MNSNISGIYEIRNTSNNKLYIGSSIDISKRFKQHIQSLKNNKHHNKYLQSAWNKYGEDSFTFKVVEVVDDECLLFSAEQKWINATKCFDGNIGYNLSLEASRPLRADDIWHLNCNIVYRDKLLDLKNMKMDKNEKLVYYVIRDFVQYPSNCVIINDNIPTFKELEPITSLTERTIRDAIKALETKNIVKLVQSGHRKAIYVNPEYYASGKELNIDTLKMFGLLKIDEEKIESYLD